LIDLVAGALAATVVFLAIAGAFFATGLAAVVALAIAGVFFATGLAAVVFLATGTAGFFALGAVFFVATGVAVPDVFLATGFLATVLVFGAIEFFDILRYLSKLQKLQAMCLLRGKYQTLIRQRKIIYNTFKINFEKNLDGLFD
jgi:hypothetical protein